MILIKSKNKIALLIAIISIVCFSVYYATAGIFKTNNQNINDLTSGLVGYWTFDGQDTDWNTNTTSDMSANSNTGAITNMSTTTDAVPGVMGQALDFDGSDDVVDYSSDTFLPKGSGAAMTISTWIKLAENFSATGVLVEQWDVGDPNDKVWDFLIQSSRSPYFRINDQGSGSEYGCSSPATLAFERWYHVVSVYDDDTDNLDIYIDGTIDCDGTTTYTLGPDNPTSHFHIGAKKNSSSWQSYFKGSIDEVRAYNRALNSSEIAELYNQGAQRLVKTNINKKTDLISGGLSGYWTFDGADTNWSSNTVTDLSENNNTGTITNMSTTTDAVPGVIGQALEFDGVDDGIDTGDIEMNSWSAITVSAWAKISIDGDLMRVASKDQVGVNGNFLLRRRTTASGGWEAWVYDDSDATFQNVQTNDGGEVGEWIHVAFTVDAATDNIIIYLNGVEKGNSNTFGSATLYDDENEEFVVGADSDVGAFENQFNGSIDEVRIYERALSAVEITELYNQGVKNLVKVNMPQTDLVPSGLVSYWSFDGQQTNWGTNITNDLSGNNNGAITNMSTTTSPVPGIIGQALDFDNSDDYISMGDPADGSLDITGSMAISAWIYPTSIHSAGQHGIVVKGSVAGSGYSMMLDNNQDNAPFSIFVKHRFSNNVGSAANSITLNKWYHIVYTFNTDTNYSYIYINGIIVNTNSTATAEGVDSSNNFEIGRRAASLPQTLFPGKIDEVRIYNRALSENEVLELYQAGAEK